jgi:hypothetical protein
MRIAHLDLSKSFSSIEQQTIILIKELAKRGIEQKLFVRKGVEVPLLDDEVTVVELSQPFCLNIFKLGGFDLIHSHSSDGNRVAYFRNMFFKTPYVATVRDDSNSYLSRSKEQFREVTETTAYNPHKISEKMILTLSKTYPNKKIVGFIGDFSGSGEEQNFIDTVRLISENHPQLYFVMIGGDGDNKLKCEEYAGNLPNISLLGEIRDPKHYIEQFDLFVHTGSKTNLILDAMKSSTPVIAENSKASKSFIEDGKDGILFEPKSSQDLGEKIVNLLRSSDMLKQVVSGGSRRVDGYSPKLLADRFETAYEKIVIG